MAKISWTDHVRTAGVLQKRVKEENNIVRTTKRRKATWIGDVLRRKRSLKHVIERKMGREDEEKDVSSYCMTAGKQGNPEIEKGSTRSYFLYNWLCKRLWTCLKTRLPNDDVSCCSDRVVE
jgi:hypothetical protein